jgi:hypothetical protein
LRHPAAETRNDPEGQKQARIVTETLTGIAATIKVINLPDLPFKGDVTDWREAGRTKEDPLKLCTDPPPPQAAAPLDSKQDTTARAMTPPAGFELRTTGLYKLHEGKEADYLPAGL